MSCRFYKALPESYLSVIRERLRDERLCLTVVGKDPFPQAAIGIPFAKPTWEEQLRHNCSGRHVLNALGLDLTALPDQYTDPKALFMRLAAQGVVFLNLSYHFLNGPVRKRRHQLELESAARINSPILDASNAILLCGEAKKNVWYDGRRCQAECVCHPDIRNRRLGNAWEDVWGQGCLAERYGLRLDRL